MSDNFTVFRKLSASYWRIEKKQRTKEKKERLRVREGNSQVSSPTLHRNLAKIKYVVDAVSWLGREGRERLTILN